MNYYLKYSEDQHITDKRGEDMDDNKASFIVYGFIFLLFAVFNIFQPTFFDMPPPLLTIYSLITVAVMSFSFSVLAPNFGKNDKSTKKRIVKKGIITGFISTLVAFVFGMLMIVLNAVDIHLFHLALILITILISSGFIAAAVFTKRELGKTQ